MYIAVSVLFAMLVLLFFTASAYVRDKSNFSQYPGFTEYFAVNPPSRHLPDQGDRELLYRYRPRFMSAEGNQLPIDFYRDYISDGVLKDAQGNILSSKVTRELLNTYKADPDIIFEHRQEKTENDTVVYGGIHRDTISFQVSTEEIHQPLTFLRYHLVFRTSGLSAGIPQWQETVLKLIGDLNDWHQLDHYTAVFVVLAGYRNEGGKPIAIMLQQHNNVRTYLVGETIQLPEDDRVVIDLAIRSNELYPHSKGRTRHRAVNMPDAKSMYFLLSGRKKPLLAGYDVTDSSFEISYDLAFLPPDDAFYTFHGFLGEKRLLPGRTGPPGAYYNTLPELMPYEIQMFSGYWREDHPGDLKRLKTTVMDTGDYIGFAYLQKKVFLNTWRQLDYRNGENLSQN